MSQFFQIRPPSPKRSETNLMRLNQNIILIAFDERENVDFPTVTNKQFVLVIFCIIFTFLKIVQIYSGEDDIPVQ